MPISGKMRYINKKFTNKIMGRIAGYKGSPIALLRHFGRSSGKKYVIPIMVEPAENGFLFALTYGRNVDWYKNVCATKKAELRWQGRDFSLSDPTLLDPAYGRAAFGRFKGVILKWVGVCDFVLMAAKELETQEVAR